MCAHRCGLVLAAAGLIACTRPATEVIVGVDTDVPTSRPVTITARLVTGGGASASRTWVRGDGLDGGIALPATFGLVPGVADARDTTGTLVLEATFSASADAPSVTVRRTARFEFTPFATTYLPIFVAVSCANRTTGCTSVPDAQCTVSNWCDDHGATCGDRGTCVSQSTQPGGAADVVVDARDASAATGDVPQPASVGSCLALPALGATPAIDGVLDPPLTLQPLPLGDFSIEPAGGVTAEAGAAWRPDGLYFFARVHQATRTPAPAATTPDAYWCGDAVELFVDPVATGLAGPFRSSARQFMIPAPADATTPSQRVSRRFVPERTDAWSGAFGAFPTADGYVVEAFLVAADLDQMAWTLDAGTTVAIDVQVDVAGSPTDHPDAFVCPIPTVVEFAQFVLRNDPACPLPCNPSEFENAYCAPTLVAP